MFGAAGSCKDLSKETGGKAAGGQGTLGCEGGLEKRVAIPVFTTVDG